jgi:hypothetical protein
MHPARSAARYDAMHCNYNDLPTLVLRLLHTSLPASRCSGSEVSAYLLHWTHSNE